MKTNYLNIDEYKFAGTNFLSPQDKFLLIKSIEKVEKINNETLGNGDISTFETEVILDEYWDLVSGPIEIFKETYSKSRKRKKLLIVFNTPYNGKQISTDKSVSKLLKLFENDQSEISLNRWISTLISSWESIINSKNNFNIITDFVRKKMVSVPLKLKRTKLLKSNKNFFLKRQGTHLFVQEIINRKVTHQQLCEQVGMRFEHSSYHSMIVEELFEFYLKTKNYKYVLEIINNISIYKLRGKKKILSSFILHIKSKNLSQYIEEIKKIAFEEIGDPEKKVYWAVWEGGNSSDRLQMENARLTLNKWILGSFVDVFFNLLINDPKRKAYWLEKIPMITSVKVYGSFDVKRTLKNDERISPYVDDSRFKTIYKGRSNAGIVMELGAFQVIEFTDSGALYCYKNSMGRIPENPHTLSDLKHTTIPMACSTQNWGSERKAYLNGKVHSLNSEGRIVHNGTPGSIRNGKIIWKDSWMERMDLWIKTFVK